MRACNAADLAINAAETLVAETLAIAAYLKEMVRK
jgi:hypothetical protein